MSEKSLALGLTLIALLALIAYRSPVTLADDPEPSPPTAEADGPPRYRFAQGAGKTAPLELSAADGTGLKLKLYQAKTVLQGPLAFTELRLTFENPEDRVREGHFRITLPDQAAISRFAMRIDDEWQEAEVVERQAARRAYEDFLHKRQDPALLEKAAGNEFSARVFPIPAKGTKELVLSYSQEIGASRQYYTLPVGGLPRVEDFEIEVQVEREGKRHTVEVKEKDFAPPGDFQLAGLQTEPAISSGPLLVARVSPKLEGGADVPEDLLILLDTSASRALGLESQQELLNDLVKRLPSVKKLTVAAFDQEVVEVYSGNPAELSWEKQTTRGAFGATDLEKALRWAARRQDHTRLLLVTDGVSTAGSTALNELFQGSGIQRVDTLITGGIRDKARMDLLAEAGTQREGMALDAASSVEALARALSGTVTSGLDVSVQDALWTWPTTFNNLQPGEQRLVYAQLPEGYEGTPKLTIGEETIEISPTTYDASPLLERSAAVAQIARWETELAEAKDPEKREELSNRIVGISKEKRVLSDRTALLVLETEADYRRFEIDRNALSDILTVNESGLQLNKRQDIPAPPPMATNRQPRTKQAEPLFGDDLKNKADQGIVQSTEVLEEPMPEATVNESRQVRRESINYAYQETAPRALTSAIPREQATGGSDESDGNPYIVDLERAELRSGEEDEKRSDSPPLSGKFAEIDQLLTKGETKVALMRAREWQSNEPGNVLALVALGNCYEAMGKRVEAARVFGSIIDLFPSRADLRRYAGGRLQTLGDAGLGLAVDNFRKAVEQRPDHVSSHRFLAFALARQGNYAGAMEALEAGLSRTYPSGRFNSYERILKDDLGLLAAAWLAKEPGKKDDIYARLQKYDSKIARTQSTRFILTWETDANDVDFHIRDSKGGHAYYSDPTLASGGELYGDVTTGYGPECFAIEGKPNAYPYELEIHYYSRGPMGYGMGQLEVLEHDGEGHLTFEERPYVVMEDGAYVKLGTVAD